MKTPNFSEYIKNSFEIVKKNKWLWIFGALVGTGGSFNSGSRISDMLDKNPGQGTQNNLLKDLPKTTSGVLGDATSALSDWFSQVPTFKWVLFTLIIVLLIVMGITIALIIQNWARGALIKGLDKARQGTHVDLKNTSPDGFAYLKRLIGLSLLLGLVVFGLGVAAPFLWVVIFLVFKNIAILKILWIILGILLFIIIFVLTLLLVTIVNVFAQRLIVLENFGVRAAFKKALYISRQTLLASFLTGFINFCFRLMAGILSLVLLAISIGPSSFIAYNLWQSNPVTSVLLITLTAMSFLVFIFFSSCLMAAMNVFSYSNWNQLFYDYLKTDHD